MIAHTETKDDKCFTYVVALVIFLAFYEINDIG